MRRAWCLPMFRADLPHRMAWRFAARVLPERWARELPGYGYLETFVRQYCLTPPARRADYIASMLDMPESPFLRVVRRAGGVHAAFSLILGSGPLEPPWCEHFVEDAIPRPTARDVANTVVVIGQFLGLPEDLVRERSTEVEHTAPERAVEAS